VQQLQNFRHYGQPAGSLALRSEAHKLINSIRNKEELPNNGKDPIIVPTYNRRDKTDSN
jgi:hypothetical protein